MNTGIYSKPKRKTCQAGYILGISGTLIKAKTECEQKVKAIFDFLSYNAVANICCY